MEQQAVEVRMGQTHLGFVDAAKGLGMLAIIWGHMDYLWSTSSVWFSSFKIAVFYVVVGLLKAYRYGERGQRDSCAQVMKKRWYSLVIPYGVFSALAILAHLAFLTIHGGSRLAALKGDVILTVTLRGVATLWFLPTLLIARAAVCGGAAGGLVCRQAHTGVCPGAGYPVRHRLFLSGNGYSRGGSPVGAGGAQSVYCFGQERQRLLVHAVRVSALPAGEAAAAGKAAGAGGPAAGESGPVAAESGPGFQLL